MGKASVRRPRVDLDARGAIRTHGRQTPRRVVIHDTESSDAKGIRDLEGIVSFWQEQDKGYGAHVIIDKDGESAYCANPNEICWAVTGRNTDTVHIELVGFASFTGRQWWLRQDQLDKCARWLAWLSLEYQVPLRFDRDIGVSGHRHQPHADHHDPGLFFPFGAVLKSANRYRREGWA